MKDIVPSWKILFMSCGFGSPTTNKAPQLLLAPFWSCVDPDIFQSRALKVILFLSDRYKIFTSDFK